MNQSDTDQTPVTDADVCIVGAGPAGALVAYRLAKSGFKVVVLEAGPRFNFDRRRQQMEKHLRPAHAPTEVWDMGGERDQYSNSGEVTYPLNTRRVKGVGGSTLAWGGRVNRLHKKDFEMESRYGLATDWPISYEDLQPYYATAERELGVSGPTDTPFGPPRDSPPPMDAFPRSYSDGIFQDAADEIDVSINRTMFAINSESYDGRVACQGYGTCYPICPSGARYSADHHINKAEAHGATIIDCAPVQRLDHSPSGQEITQAVYVTSDGTMHHQPADAFVLAAGAVEIPRLLLLSRSPQYPDGLANSSGLVGRYFMERPTCGVITRLDRRTRQHLIGFGTSATQQFYDYGLDTDPPPGSVKIHFENDVGPTPLRTALGQQNLLNSVQDAFGNPLNLDDWADIGQAVFTGDKWGDELLGTVRENYGNAIGISAAVEGLPKRKNCVTLNQSKTDDQGNPIPDISWNPSSFARKTMDHAFDLIDQILDELDGEVGSRHRYRNWKGIGHNMGTTRMSDDPATGVVDPNCRTHDLENLFIASSSVFVTSGAVQPTLTIAALALRLSDYLSDELG